MAFAECAGDRDRREAAEEVLRPFSAPWIAWAVVYVLFDVFPDTADRIESSAVELLCLNLPAQIVLIALSFALVASFGRRARAPALLCASLATLLIAAHVVATALSVA
ncbi:MAG: hypothetical protein ACF8XB_03585 [Planctomycetota bacterium JB042]